MVTGFIEDSVRGALTVLQTQLPAELAAVAAKYAPVDSALGQTIPLPPPNDYGYGQHHNHGAGKPTLIAWGHSPTFVPGSGVLNNDHGWGEYTLQLLVEVDLESDSESAVEAMAGRYLEAMFKVLASNQTLGAPAVIRCLPMRGSITPGISAVPTRAATWECELGIEPQY